jgi:hypothetical protein
VQFESLVPTRENGTMIKLTDADIAEFQALYKKENGREIGKEEAAVYAERIIALVAFAAGLRRSEHS